MKLEVGDRVKLAPDGRRWWRVQAASENFTVCVQQRPFKQKGDVFYTVLDWRKGIRGPCNLIGQGWGDGTYTEKECAELLAAFEANDDAIAYDQAQAAAGRQSWPVYPETHVEVSHRNNVPLEVLARA